MNKKREYVKKRHKLTVKLLTFFVGPFYKWHVGYKRRRIRLSKTDKPYLLISNHVQWLDPILTTLTFGDQIYYLATDHMFFDGFKTKLIKYFFNPIPKSKNNLDIAALKRVIKVINEGGNVGIFIEGDSTMNGAATNMPGGIGKLALKLKVPIVLFTFDYSYLKQPRWAKYRRKGTFSGEVQAILRYEDYKDMTDTKLSHYIEQKVTHNVYDLKPKRFKGKNKAVGLEKVIFNCPKCQTKENLLVQNDFYLCCNCGFRITHDDFGYLHSDEWTKYKSLVAVDEENKIAYQDMIVRNKDFRVTATGHFFLQKINERKEKGVADIVLDRKSLRFSFRDGEQLTYLLNEIALVTLAQKETVLIYLKDGQRIMLSLTAATKTFAYEFTVAAQVIININKYESMNKPVIKLDVTDLGL
ncbi:MAG TPA: 1-acyl-sn-glycerol-3-phosphate acyltransferase [Bacilli bacterium]|nr:1-acyl-sn-glycerol-3-phosphate acyltransferase [Bacilli bacterium]